MNNAATFRLHTKTELQSYLIRQQMKFPQDQCLRVDLHCHDLNSDIPDEFLGRMLRLPETWLPTERLLQVLRANMTDLVTITNHNNARSCWDLLDQGRDVLVGAEFTCTIPDMSMMVHVLAYGFSNEQEQRLHKLRGDIYRFQEYTSEHDIPTVLAHPMYFPAGGCLPSPAQFDKLALLFERFEAVNGQRDSWQNLLTMAWVNDLTPERIDNISKAAKLSPGSFCRHPYRKVLTGGSDDHMGFSAGMAGSILFVPDLQTRLKEHPISQLALQALRTGQTVPYGGYAEDEMLMIALLDYFCQAAINIEDPGLIRVLLHKGTAVHKMWALVIANMMLELKRHRYTLKFLRGFHEALHGKRPSALESLLIARNLRPIIHQIDRIAASRTIASRNMREIMAPVLQIFHELMRIVAERTHANLKIFQSSGLSSKSSSGEMIGKIEVPSHFRALFGKEAPQNEEMTSVNLGDLFDGMSFPVLASLVISGAAFLSNQALTRNRRFLRTFAEALGRYQHPKRALWLTDSLFDNCSLAGMLQNFLQEAQKRDLPIDFLCCGGETCRMDHVISLEPVMEFPNPFQKSQMLRFPNLLELQSAFTSGGYDRVICSGELAMGLFALYLKTAFSVPVYFYAHTDWMDFAERKYELDVHKMDRIRRLLRIFYRGFDGIWAPNSEIADRMASASMGLTAQKIFRTSSWADQCFQWHSVGRGQIVQGLSGDEPVMLFAGPIEEEHGVAHLPRILEGVRSEIPRVRMAVAGEGSATDGLRTAMPSCMFLGPVPREELPVIFSCADLLVSPTPFDSLGTKVLEAMSCGLPAAALAMKGPKDIIVDGISGILANEVSDLIPRITGYFGNTELMNNMPAAAYHRSRQYSPNEIICNFLSDLGLPGQEEFRKAPAQEVGVATGEDSGSIWEELLEIVNG